MDFLYLIIFIVITMINGIETVLLKKTDLKSFSTKKILFISEEASLLQCAQRCKFCDKNAIVDYKDTTCRCISYEDDDEDKDPHTLSGIFLNEKTMTMKKEKEKKKKEPRGIINVALKKNAQQSTTYSSDYVASNAVDGTLRTRSFTLCQDNQWWSVDFDDTIDIMYMIIVQANIAAKFNRALIVETRQKDNGEWITCKNIGDLTKEFLNSNFTCEIPTNARYLKIRSTSTCHIHLREFEVYALV